MKCCISSCKMYSDRRSHDTKGVTFHSFPSDDTARQQWIACIGRKNWTPSRHTKICSCHFKKEDLFATSSGFRKIKIGAVPCLLLDKSKPDETDPDDLWEDTHLEAFLSPYERNQSIKLKALQQKYRRLIKRYAALEDYIKNKVPHKITQEMDISILRKRNHKLREKNKELVEIIKKLKKCINQEKERDKPEENLDEICNVPAIFINSEDNLNFDFDLETDFIPIDVNI